jgi:hypothetical protein
MKQNPATPNQALQRTRSAVTAAAVTLLASLGGFVLWICVVTADLPPFHSENLSERFLVLASAVISWPCIVVINILPSKAAEILILPAFLLSGLFWAALIEVFAVRYAKAR